MLCSLNLCIKYRDYTLWLICPSTIFAPVVEFIVSRFTIMAQSEREHKVTSSCLAAIIDGENRWLSEISKNGNCSEVFGKTLNDFWTRQTSS